MKEKKNLTVRISAQLLKQARLRAVEEEASLSEWIAQLIANAIHGDHSGRRGREKALHHLENPLSLGGEVFSREKLHDR